MDRRDNKRYKIIYLLGNWWFAENLKYEINESYAYDDESTNINNHGRLYSFESAEKACPPGWRIPYIYEWEELVNAFNFELYNFNSNSNEDNIKKLFNLTPSGKKGITGKYVQIGKYGRYWSKYNQDVDWGIWQSINNFYPENLLTENRKGVSYSIRCIKDDKNKKAQNNVQNVDAR